MFRSRGSRRRNCGCPRSVWWIGAVGTAMAVAMPLTAAASDTGRARATGAAARGVVYGGFTPQDWPVVVEVSKDRRRVVRTAIGLTLTCAPSGLTARIGDEYRNLPLSKNGRFSDSFGPNRMSNPDGTSTEFQGSVTGTTNAKRTKMSGTWQVAWTAKQ
jgi:hypothetical protein